MRWKGLRLTQTNTADAAEPVIVFLRSETRSQMKRTEKGFFAFPVFFFIFRLCSCTRPRHVPNSVSEKLVHIPCNAVAESMGFVVPAESFSRSEPAKSTN